MLAEVIHSTDCEALSTFYSEPHPLLRAHLRSLLKWTFDCLCDIWGQAVRAPLFLLKQSSLSQI